MEVVANRWTFEVVRVLLSGRARFSEIAGAIPGISDRVLSERLKTLEAEGLVNRDVIPETPVRVEYRLTDKGGDLSKAVGALASWAARWITSEEAEAAG